MYRKPGAQSILPDAPLATIGTPLLFPTFPCRFQMPFGTFPRSLVAQYVGASKPRDEAYSNDPIHHERIPREGKLQIHAIIPDEKGWKHECNRNNRKSSHDYAEIVGDDRSEGIHGPGENRRVDVGHLDSLLVVDDDIFQEFPLLFCVHAEIRRFLQFFQEDFIGRETGGEVHE